MEDKARSVGDCQRQHRSQKHAVSVMDGFAGLIMTLLAQDQAFAYL